MKGRLIIYSLIVIFLMLMVVINYWMEEEILWSALLVSCAALFASAYTLWNNTRFQLSNNKLVVQQLFRPAHVIDLADLNSWKALSYHIRGTQRKTLILFFETDKKLSFDNADYKEAFDEVENHLEHTYATRKM